MNVLWLGEDTLNAFLISIIGLLYDVVSVLFELFSMLAKAPAVSDEKFQQIITNFYLVLGTVMLFVIAFSLLKAMVSVDDTKSTDASTKIVKNFLTSLLILIFLPTIFNFAFSFQNAIINQNTIGKLLGGSFSTSGSKEHSLSTIGNEMTNSVFTVFFSPNMGSETCSNSKTINECKKEIKSSDYLYQYGKGTLDKTENLVLNGKSFGLYAYHANNVSKGEVNFNFLLCLAAGVYLLYVIFSFCLDLGLRLVKLVFYQIIAPIPVMFRVVPNSKINGTFNEWLKITITCYLEVFLRLTVLYFGLYLFKVLTDVETLKLMFGTTNYQNFVGLVGKVIIVLGIVTFIKQVPKLLGDVLGFDSSNMKLNIRQKLADGGLFAAGTAIGGAAISTVRNLNKFEGAFKGKSRKEKFTNGLRMLKGGAAGIVGGGYRGYKSGKDAKSFSEMKSGISSAVKATTAKQDERNDLFSRGGNSIIGGYRAKSNDKMDSIKEFWFGEQEQANEKIKSYDELIGLNDSAKKSAKSLVEKGKKMSENQLITKYGDAVASKIQNSKVAELEYEVAQKQLDAAINSDRTNPNYENEVQIARERVMETKDAMGKINKDAEDYITELLYAKKEAWDNFNADLKIDLSNGRVAADKVRVKLQSPEFSSESGIVNAGITPETVDDIGYKIDLPDGVGIKAALDNLEIEKGKLATESAIYNETHKSSDNK